MKWERNASNFGREFLGLKENFLGGGGAEALEKEGQKIRRKNPASKFAEKFAEKFTGNFPTIRGTKKKIALQSLRTNIQAPLNPIFLTPFLMTYFVHWIGNVLLHCFGKSDCHQLGERLHDDCDHTVKFPNPYLASLCAQLCWYHKWKKAGGVGPMRETIARESELPGHEGKRTCRHGTSTGQGPGQSEGSALHRLRHVHFGEIERCAVTRGVARGNARGVAWPMPCNACLENVQNL